MQQFPAYFTGYENSATQQTQQQAPQQSQDANQQQQHSQPLLTGPNLAIYSPAAMQPLSVLAAAQRKDPDPNAMVNAVAAANVPVELGVHGKPKRKQVKNACVNCQKACKKCDIGRPCQRCIKYGITDTCVNSVRKERKKGIKRGPYKKRSGESAASSGASTPNMASPAAPMYANGVRPAAIPIHYQPFPHHYDPYHVYTSNSQMMPQAYMVPASIQQMYPGHPVMSYQAAMNIISPQQQQQSLQSAQQQQPQHQQQQQQHQQQQQPQQQQALGDQQANNNNNSNIQQQQTTANNTVTETKPNAEGDDDDDDEGSKLTILSRLCSAVLDRNDTPKQETDIKTEGNQENTPPPSRPQSATS